MSKAKAQELFQQGRELLKLGERLKALGFFERAHEIDPDNARFLSYLGMCIAYERRLKREALRLCKWALKEDPKNPEQYLNLGKVYLVFGCHSDAIVIFRKGMRIDNDNPEIITELQAMGIRKKPVIPFLSRGHFLNKYIGIALARIGLR